MMKKMLALLTALILVATMAATLAFATETVDGNEEPESFQLSGFITAIEDGFIMMSGYGTEYQVNIDENTIIEGTEALNIGDWIRFVHNGQMTRSLPPQLYAQVIRSYCLNGVVSELTENSFTLTADDETAYVVNFDPEAFIGVQDGMEVKVWFDGMMTRSLPAQVTATHIRLQEMAGVITEVTEEGFLMTDEAGVDVFVHVSEMTNVFTAIEEGAAIRVVCDGTATMSIPAQITALEILPALPEIEVPADDAAEEIVEESAEESGEESTEETAE